MKPCTRSIFCSILIAFSSSILLSCSQENDPQQENSNAAIPSENESGRGYAESQAVFAKGADISWLTQMEDQHVVFRFPDGSEGDCISILKSQGINAVRFRLWVDPINKYSSTDDVIAKSLRAKAAGCDIMLDFHYSDSWADPGKQNIPSAWYGLNLDQLVVKVNEYTRETLMRFKEAGITPKWVQVGNETGNGMLWPFGKADVSPKGYARLSNAGYDAVKEIFPDAKVIVHLENGQNPDLYRWLFGLLADNGGKWDVIGMSLYPEPDNYAWMVSECRRTILEMIQKYDTELMLCEVGMGNSYVAECKEFLTLCLNLQDEIPGGRFLGVFYWEPQVYNDWNGYKKGAFTSDGSPSEAMSAFKPSSSGIHNTYNDN